MPTERFIEAVEHGILHRVKEEIEEDPEAWLNDDEEGIFPLSMAAGDGRLEIVRYFLDLARRRGPDTLKTYMNYASRHNKWLPALELAIQSHHLDVVDLLLSYGAVIAVYDDNNEFVYDIFHTACEYSDACIVQCFLAHQGVDVNAVVYHYTALYEACMRNDRHAAPIVKSLLEAGANPTLTGPRFRRTPLQCAKTPEVRRLLEVRSPDEFLIQNLEFMIHDS